MALGVELPKQVFGHPWLLVGEGKMSKSKGNVIYADDLVHLFGVDAVRYYLLHEMPFANDGTLTYELLIERINSDLANILGNLVNRTVTMVHRYSGGVIGAPTAAEPVDEELRQICLEAPAKARACMDELKVADAMDQVFAIFRRANKYIDETMPWVLGKDESKKERLDTVLYNLLESIRFGAVLLESFLPETAQKIYAQLNTSQTSMESLEQFGALQPGDTVGQAEILFARLDLAKKMEEVNAYNAAKNPAPAKEELPPHEPKAQIVYDDFDKVELTVAKVLHCEPVPKSKKLLRFELDLGYEKRQILSGIAQWYKPEDLIGHNVVIVSNLAPRKMMGLESNGMILSATCGENDVRVMLADQAVPGARSVMMRLFDTHAHYDDQRFEGDRDQVLGGLREAGVERVLNPGADLASSEQAVRLAQQYDFLYAGVGVHPHSAAEYGDAQEKRLAELLAQPKVRALGEIGLDYHYDFSPREQQKACFERQLALAKALDVPVDHPREGGLPGLPGDS